MRFCWSADDASIGGNATVVGSVTCRLPRCLQGSLPNDLKDYAAAFW